MFVGDKGKIIGDFRGEKPVLYSGNKKILPDDPALGKEQEDRNDSWISSFKNNTQSAGSFYLCRTCY